MMFEITNNIICFINSNENYKAIFNCYEAIKFIRVCK